MTIAGTGVRKRYYCANHKEKGSAVCRGMPGLRQADAEALALTGVRQHLMLPDAYEKFRTDFARHIQAQGKELAADQKFRLAELRELEAQQANLVRAVAQGQALDTLLPALEAVERSTAAMSPRASLTSRTCRSGGPRPPGSGSPKTPGRGAGARTGRRRSRRTTTRCARSPTTTGAPSGRDSGMIERATSRASAGARKSSARSGGRGRKPRRRPTLR